MISLNNSINNEDKKNPSISDNNKTSSNNKQKDINDEGNKNNKIIHELFQDKNSFIINDKVIHYVEEFGYKREYIIKSLLNDELNYCTATYYIKLYLMND